MAGPRRFPLVDSGSRDLAVSAADRCWDCPADWRNHPVDGAARRHTPVDLRVGYGAAAGTNDRACGLLPAKAGRALCVACLDRHRSAADVRVGRAGILVATTDSG